MAHRMRQFWKNGGRLRFFALEVKRSRHPRELKHKCSQHPSFRTNNLIYFNLELNQIVKLIINPMNTTISTLILITLAVGCLAVDPPIYNFSYHITFDDIFVVNGTNYEVNGQQFYDPVNNRERIDRVNGRYESFCGPVLPNVSTPCIHYVVNNKRWLVFPQKSQCCFCCDSSHGCGILKPDWLKNAVYMGE